MVSVLERFGRNGNKSLAFCSGWKLKKGAMASSAAPDDNNLVVMGVSAEDMSIAANYLIEQGGGQRREIGTADVRPVAVAALEDALLRERADGFPDAVPRNAERFGKRPLGGQLIPHLEPALFDSILYFLGKPLICLEGFPCFGKRFSLLRLVWSLL